MTERQKLRPRGRPFAAGESGNPGGRPKEERELVEALRLRGVDLANKLVQLAMKGNVRAIEVALNRAYGKPRQVVEFKGDDSRPRWDLSKLSREEISQLRALGEKAGGYPPKEKSVDDDDEVVDAH